MQSYTERMLTLNSALCILYSANKIMAINILTANFHQLLSQLNDDTPAIWGVMTAQHMVEHVSAAYRIGNGKWKLNVEVSPERVESGRKFLHSPDPMPRNVRIDVVPAVPPPYKFPDLKTAKIILLKEIDDFIEYWEMNPDAIENHPRFGAINREEWVLFENKHTDHHFRQFGLLPE